MAGIGDFKDEDHATVYGLFRPVYPQSVSQIISSYMGENKCSEYERAIDVCCGSGQSTMLLSPFFKSVCGYDNSPAQISQAKSKHETKECNVNFEIGDAHDLPVVSSFVDLVTCAMGWHWLNPEKFYSEAKRVLKPGGCIAVYGYNTTVSDNKSVGSLVEAFKKELIEKDCVDERAFYTFNEYRDVLLPFSKVQRLKFDLPQRASLDQLFGFFESITSYRAYCKKFPTNNFLQTLREEHSQVWPRDNVEEFTYPGFIILGISEGSND